MKKPFKFEMEIDFENNKTHIKRDGVITQGEYTAFMLAYILDVCETREEVEINISVIKLLMNFIRGSRSGKEAKEKLFGWISKFDTDDAKYPPRRSLS